jgi:hypothetical protein
MNENTAALKRAIGGHISVTEHSGTTTTGRLWSVGHRSIWIVADDKTDWFIPHARIASWNKTDAASAA